MATRTAKARIEVKNPDHRIKHEMFADVEIDAGADEPERLVVPVSALIDSGTRQVVLVDRGEGRFEPRLVKPGARGDGFVEIAEGVKEGEQVVIAANFLIDAESNLKAALAGFTADAPAKEQPKGEASPLAGKSLAEPVP
jgi:Cu(I)/Ag(I) efflux system membrane fusion protein